MTVDADLPISLTMNFAAFLSYSSHDVRIARRLHRALEGVRLPSDLRRPGRTHLRPIFRDLADASASPSLSLELQRHLEDSAYLVVLCSPAAAQSPYVAEEIRYFRQLGRGERILAIIAAGKPERWSPETPNGAFPPALVDDGPSVPLAANITRADASFSGETLRLAARMLDRRFDELFARHRRERRLGWTIGFAIFVVVAATVLILGGNAFLQRRLATRSEAERLAAEATRTYQRGETLDAMALALRAMETEQTPAVTLFGQKLLLENRAVLDAVTITSTSTEQSVDAARLVPGADAIAFVSSAVPQLPPDGDLKKLGQQVSPRTVTVMDFAGKVLDSQALKNAAITVAAGQIGFAMKDNRVVSELFNAAMLKTFDRSDLSIIRTNIGAHLSGRVVKDPLYEPYLKDAVPPSPSILMLVDQLEPEKVYGMELPTDLADITIFGGAQLRESVLIGVEHEAGVEVLDATISGEDLRIARRVRVDMPAGQNVNGMLRIDDDLVLLIASDAVFALDLRGFLDEEDNPDARHIAPVLIARSIVNHALVDVDYDLRTRRIRLIYTVWIGENTPRREIRLATIDVGQLFETAGADPRWIDPHQLALSDENGTRIFSYDGRSLTQTAAVVPPNETMVCGGEPAPLPVVTHYDDSVSLAKFLSTIGRPCMPESWRVALEHFAGDYCRIVGISGSPDGRKVGLLWHRCDSDLTDVLVSVHDRATGALQDSVRFEPPDEDNDVALGLPLIGAPDGRLYLTTGQAVYGTKPVVLRLPQHDLGPLERVPSPIDVAYWVNGDDPDLAVLDGSYVTGGRRIDLATLQPVPPAKPLSGECHGKADLGSRRDIAYSQDDEAICISLLDQNSALFLKDMVPMSAYRVVPQPGVEALAVVGSWGRRSLLTVTDLPLPTGEALITEMRRWIRLVDGQ